MSRLSSAFRQRCTRCGGAVRRSRREASARRQAAASGVRRYACTDAACGWHGLLPRLSRTQVRSEIVALRRHWRHWRWPVLAFAVLGLAAAAVVRQSVGTPPPFPVVPAGQSHYGRPLEDAHPLQARFDAALAATPVGQAVAGLTLRQHCAWGRPGGNPYRGTVAEALEAAGLTADVVAQIADQVRLGAVSERLVIASDGIRAERSGRVFNPAGMAMTYGRTLCLGTHVNFAPGHTEPASLYEARDSKGRLHTVMVPDVCGNVTMISEGKARRDALPRADGGGQGDALWLIDPLEGGRGFGPPVNSVPEPGTLWGVLTGLALLLGLRGPRRS